MKSVQSVVEQVIVRRVEGLFALAGPVEGRLANARAPVKRPIICR